MTDELQKKKRLIFIDTAYLDRTALGLSGFLSQKIRRPLAKADMPRFIECLTEDLQHESEWRGADVFLMFREGEQKNFEAFVPSDFERDYQGQAFTGPLGEFSFLNFPLPPAIDDAEAMHGLAKLLIEQKDYAEVLLLSDFNYAVALREELGCAKSDITLHHAMLPHSLQDDVLNIGFALMAAYDIKADEMA